MSRGFMNVDVRPDKHGWPFVGLHFVNLPMDMLQRHKGASAAIEPRIAWGLGWLLVKAALMAWTRRIRWRLRRRLVMRASNDG